MKCTLEYFPEFADSDVLAPICTLQGINTPVLKRRPPLRLRPVCRFWWRIFAMTAFIGIRWNPGQVLGVSRWNFCWTRTDTMRPSQLTRGCQAYASSAF